LIKIQFTYRKAKELGVQRQDSWTELPTGLAALPPSCIGMQKLQNVAVYGA